MRVQPKYVSQMGFSSWCGPACVCSVLNKENTLQSLHLVAERLCSAGPTATDTTTIDNFRKYFTETFIVYDVLIKPSIDILEFQDDRTKIIVLLRSEHNHGPGHAVVYWKSDSHRVFIMDPSTGHDNYVIRARSQFENRIDYAIVVKMFS